MNKQEKQDVLKMKSVAYWSAFDGVEVKKIENDINKFCICVSGCWYGGKENKKVHNLKIYYDTDKTYIKLHGVKLYFSDCVRM